MSEQNLENAGGQAAGKSPDGTEKSVEYFQGETDKSKAQLADVQKEFDTYKQETASALKLRDTFQGNPDLVKYTQAYKQGWEKPVQEATPSGFDPQIDFDPTEALINPESPSAKYLQSKKTEVKPDVPQDIMDRLDRMEQKDADTGYIDKLMVDHKMTRPVATQYLASIRSNPEDYLLGDGAALYAINNFVETGGGSLQDVRDTQAQPSSVASIQGAAAPVEASDTEKFWKDVEGQSKEMFQFPK